MVFEYGLHETFERPQGSRCRPLSGRSNDDFVLRRLIASHLPARTNKLSELVYHVQPSSSAERVVITDIGGKFQRLNATCHRARSISEIREGWFPSIEFKTSSLLIDPYEDFLLD